MARQHRSPHHNPCYTTSCSRNAMASHRTTLTLAEAIGSAFDNGHNYHNFGSTPFLRRLPQFSSLAGRVRMTPRLMGEASNDESKSAR
ncbi:hypothetical protein V6N13_038535 [Hibiscus sabdariffa]|uniref:Uncharacterized protein n=1 Tax=Hibiscus sabdariffa TaxID=183260 RepID=A0ABR2S2A5_9ROSI